MVRKKRIDYKRVTFSFPAQLLERLRERVGAGNMSAFLTEAVEEKLKEEILSVDQILADLRDLKLIFKPKNTFDEAMKMRGDEFLDRAFQYIPNKKSNDN